MDKVSIARNPRARHDYHLLETWEAGLVLTGTEVKSLRAGKASLGEAYAHVRNVEVWLEGLSISKVAPYTIIPGTKIVVKGDSFVDDQWGAASAVGVVLLVAVGAIFFAVSRFIPLDRVLGQK